MPVVQVATFPASQAYLSNRELFKDALDVIASSEGHISSYHGVQNEVEGAKLGYFITVWETYEHHKKLISSSRYEGLLQSLKPALAGKLDRHHFETTADPNISLSAQTLELVSFALKEGKSKEVLFERIGSLTKELDKATGAYPPCVWGESLEVSGILVMLVGWDSRQAHLDAVALEPFTSIIASIGELADVGFTHTDLVKYASA